MSALRGLVAFELRHHLRRISTWVYFGVLFLIAWTITASRAGAWREFDMGSELLLANSPIRIATLMLTLGMLAVPITSAIAGTAVYRDFETRAYPLFFTTAVSKWAYLGGRYLGAVLANLLILLSIPLGIIAASASPFRGRGPGGALSSARVPARHRARHAPQPASSSPPSSDARATTRRMMPVYVGGFALLVGWAIAVIRRRGGGGVADLPGRPLRRGADAALHALLDGDGAEPGRSCRSPRSCC
jgi:hypothetical protein